MYSKLAQNKNLILKLVSSFLLIIIVIANIKRAINGEFDVYDYGIFQQGIFELAQGDINPFMSVRDLKLWNDHFMPVLFLAVPWVWLWDFSTFSMAIFEWLWFVAAVIIVFNLSKEKPFPVKVAAVLLILFAKGFLSGLHFAVHPGVWSGPIWILFILLLGQRAME